MFPIISTTLPHTAAIVCFKDGIAVPTMRLGAQSAMSKTETWFSAMSLGELGDTIASTKTLLKSYNVFLLYSLASCTLTRLRNPVYHRTNPASSMPFICVVHKAFVNLPTKSSVWKEWLNRPFCPHGSEWKHGKFDNAFCHCIFWKLNMTI